VTHLCKKFKFAKQKCLLYDTLANGLAEPFNKNLCNLLSEVVAKSKQYWYERLWEALWAYRTTYKTLTQSSLVALVYGIEAVLPLELQIPSPHITIQRA